MGAFNWIVVEGRCPGCHATAEIRCQAHTASSSRGPFCDHTYRLGERMAWWRADRTSWWRRGQIADQDWRDDIMTIPSDEVPGAVEESCCSYCTACKAGLYVVIRFRDLVPERVLSISVEPPDGYPI
jgi:hypothetical protein